MKNQKSKSSDQQHSKLNHAMAELLDKVLEHGAHDDIAQAVIRLDKVLGHAR
jgi:hypothetical protein